MDVKYKIVVTDDRFDNYDAEKSVLNPIGADLTVCDCKTSEALIAACRDADGLMVNLAEITAQVIDNLPKCKIIARYGVGYDNVDVKACTRREIHVANVTDYCQEEVSDHALALILSCARQITLRDARIRRGEWNIRAGGPIFRIAGKTIAFLGFGSIARCLNRKIMGLNPGRVLVYDPFLDAGFIRANHAEQADFITAIREADIISVHLPLNGSTKGILNEQAFKLMKPDAILVNTSRGAVIDEPSLIIALQSRQIRWAGLDVHANEPISAGSPLMTLENCVMTDHIGWYSEESVIELKRKTAENVRAVLIGGKPVYPVNTF